MSVKKEASGRRSIQVEVEVPGTPEEVWQAIATGPGISSWFVPTRSEERAGGQVVSEAPRHIALRDMLNHLAHHRGQLTVYLRLLGAKVPAVYGPSADEQRFA